MKAIYSFLVVLLSIATFATSEKAYAQAEPYIGQIIFVPYNFCPRGWADTNGQTLSIAQYTALFSLLGTTYGGNGQTTFALPDLRGRVAIHTGQGPGLSRYDLGEVGGTEQVTLSTAQMPAHTHAMQVSKEKATQTDPSGQSLAASGSYRPGSINTTLNPSTVGVAGGSQPVQIVQPYLTMRACIALEGIYPSRP